MNTHTVPGAEFSYHDLGVSLIAPRILDEKRVRQPQARVIVLPDWQGGHTHYATRMAMLFGDALQAETLIFNQYPPGVQPKAYIGDGDGRVAQLLGHLDRFRTLLRMVVARSAAHWTTNGTPLILLGFCFGGTAAFEAARADDTIDIAFSIHGTPVIDPARMRRPGPGASMHYIGGGDDGLVPEWSVSAFREEIAQDGIFGSLQLLPGQGHSFTKKEIGAVGPMSRYSAPALFETVERTKSIVASETSFFQSNTDGDS